jgi:hypothetical protein
MRHLVLVSATLLALVSSVAVHADGPAAKLAGLWRGQIEPLQEPFSLYLVIQEAKDGSLQAFIRNPERNVGMRRAYAVSGRLDHLVLDDTQRKGDQITGRYDPRLQAGASLAQVLQLPQA